MDRHRAAFRALVRGDVDILFANEAEICSLYEEEDFERAAGRARAEVSLACLTRSERGSVILRGEERLEVAAEPVAVVDTTGAGDAYAAGFLAGFAADRPLAECGRLGSRAAAAVIAQYGARLPPDVLAAIARGLSRSRFRASQALVSGTGAQPSRRPRRCVLGDALRREEFLS